MSRLDDLRNNLKAAIGATKKQRDALDAEILALQRSLAALGDGNLTESERRVLAPKLPKKTGKRWGPGKLRARVLLELGKRKQPVKVDRIAAVVGSTPGAVSNILSELTKEKKAQRTKKGFYQKVA